MNNTLSAEEIAKRDQLEELWQAQYEPQGQCVNPQLADENRRRLRAVFDRWAEVRPHWPAEACFEAFCAGILEAKDADSAVHG